MKMAPYQLEATAEAAGMTVDQLIKGAEQQKLFNDMSKKLGITLDKNGKLSEADLQKAISIGDAEAKNYALQQQQASAQEKFALALDNIKASFGAIASGPLGDIVGMFGSLLGNAPILKGLIVGIGVALLPVAYTMAAAAIAAISTMSALTLGIGAIAIAAGITTAAIAMKSEKSKAESMHDGMIAPDGGLMVSGEKGTYQLHKDDTVVAGTGLGNTSPTLSTSSTTSSDSGANMSELVSLMKQLVSAVSQPAIVKIGNKVVNEIDKIQSMNRSYVGKVDNSYGAV
jgi:hypothetical protein